MSGHCTSATRESGVEDEKSTKFSKCSPLALLSEQTLRCPLIAVVDGLKGFPDAINAAFPDTTVQTCIVHLVRHSLNF